MKDSLEEAAERFAEKYKGEEQDPWYDFMEGAKWQMERSYSEEDLEVAFFEGQFGRYSFNDWFEQFKSKQDEQSKAD